MELIFTTHNLKKFLLILFFLFNIVISFSLTSKILASEESPDSFDFTPSPPSSRSGLSSISSSNISSSSINSSSASSANHDNIYCYNQATKQKIKIENNQYWGRGDISDTSYTVPLQIISWFKNDSFVGRKHFKFVIDNSKKTWGIIDYSLNGVLVNKERIERKKFIPLSLGVIITLGFGQEFICDRRDHLPATLSSIHCLDVKSGTIVGLQDYQIWGRDSLDPNILNIYKNEFKVSRHHLKVEITDEGVTQIIDNSSLHGVLINNTKIIPNRPYVIKGGEEITLGIDRKLICDSKEKLLLILKNKQKADLQNSIMEENRRMQALDKEIARLQSLITDQKEINEKEEKEAKKAKEIKEDQAAPLSTSSSSSPSSSSVAISSNHNPSAVSLDKGPRSLMMYDTLKKELKDGSLMIGGRKFIPVDSTTTNFMGPMASLGGSILGREIILLNYLPEQLAAYQSILELKYAHLLTELKTFTSPQDDKSDTTEDFLKQIKKYVQTYIFPLDNKGNLVALVEEDILQYKKENPELHIKEAPFIPIEYFIHKKHGVCRHHAIVTAYLIDRLIRENKMPLRGNIHVVRGELPQAPHAWVVFRSYNGKSYHLDTIFDKLVDISSDTGLSSLESIYQTKEVAIQDKRVRNLPNM